MIYASYFAKLRELEKHNIIPILICGKASDWYILSDLKED